MARPNRGMIPWRSLTKGQHLPSSTRTPAAKSTAKNVVYPTARAVAPLLRLGVVVCAFPDWERRHPPVHHSSFKSDGGCRRVGTLWMFAFVFAFTAQFSTIASDIPDVSSEYQRQTWGREDGFPDNWVWSILQTRDGYLWAATRGGLARYDGDTFKVYNRANTAAFTTDEITTLAEDTDGSLWIGTADGLLRFKNQRFTRFDLKEVLPNHRVLSLAAGRHQAVWLGTPDGIAWIERESGRVVPVRGPHSVNYITALQADDEGTLWAGTREGLLRLNERTGAVLCGYETPASGLSIVKSLSLAADGVLWGLFVDGAVNLHLFHHEKNGAWTRRLSGGFPGGYKDVTSFLQMDRQTNWWFPTQDRRIIRFHDPQTASIPVPLSEPADVILSGCLDREGSLWFGTHYAGLWRLRARLIQNISSESGLPAGVARAVYPARDGSLWIGTDAGLSHFIVGRARLLPSRRDGVCVTYTKSDGLSRNDIRAVAEDASGTIWVGTGNGLDSIKDGRITQHRFHGPIIDNDLDEVGRNKVRAIMAARDGSLWVGVQRGLHRLGNGQDQFFTTNQLSNPDVRALLEDRAGNVWIATDGGGVDCWHQGRFSALTTTNGLSSNHCWALLEDSRGDIWIAAEGGLNRFRGGQVAVFNTRRGLLENRVNQIIEDSLGNLWLGGELGLYCVSLSDLDAVADRRKPVAHPRRYGQADGMLSSLTTGGQQQPAACKSTDGRLWFFTTRGVAVIDPATALAQTAPPPPVIIQQVLAGNQIVYGDDLEPSGGGARLLPSRGAAGLWFRHSDAITSQFDPDEQFQIAPAAVQVLEIHFSALDFSAPLRTRYKYRLEDYEKDWTDAGNRRVAYYTGLPPGCYRFRVIASDHHNLWNETGANFDFYLLPFYYQTVWFGAGIVAAIGLAVFLLYRWRVRDLQKVHALHSEISILQERARIAADMHDDLGSRISAASTVRLLASQDAQLSEPTKRLMDTLHAIHGQIAEAADETVWGLNPRQDTLAGLISYLRDFAQPFLSGSGIRVRFDFPIPVPHQRLGGETRRHAYLVAKEALHNVVKHARAKEVRVRLHVENRIVILTIEDDGCGFTAPAGLDPTENALKVGSVTLSGIVLTTTDPCAPPSACQDPAENASSTADGLGNLQMRAGKIGGKLEITASPGKGTTIRLIFPLKR